MSIFVSFMEELAKYKQIIFKIENDISEGRLRKGDILASLSQLRNMHQVSRDTVVKAINDLKARGIVEGIAGKGIYISSENIDVKTTVFLLFDELNSFKQELYNAILSSLNSTFKIDVFFHNFDLEVFRNLINENGGKYNKYVIMPANLENTETAISRLPEESVYILDQMPKELSGYSAIYQTFEKDILTNLEQLMPALKPYNRLILVAGDKQPQGITMGFRQFVKKYDLPFEIKKAYGPNQLKKGDVYVLLEDQELLDFIKDAKFNGFVLGKDIGVVSYNDSMFKEILEGGITCISTDFKKMGEDLAKMLQTKGHANITNPSKLVIRNSL